MPDRGETRRIRRLTVALLVPFLLVVLVLSACGKKASSLSGLDEAAAKGALAAAGLQVGRVTYDPQAKAATWTVVAQSVKPGESRDEGVAVDITLAGSPPTTVPALTGVRRARADRLLAAAKLKVKKSQRRYDERVAADCVIRQTPRVGTKVPEGSAISIVLSKGPAPRAVPLTMGRDASSATAHLKKAGFRVRLQRVYSSARKGAVVGQNPARGKLVPGKAVTLIVSRGAEMVRVPNVGRMSPHSAEEILTAAGFRTRLVLHNYGDVSYGGMESTYNQSPRAGTYAPRHSTVTYHSNYEDEGV